MTLLLLVLKFILVIVLINVAAFAGAFGIIMFCIPYDVWIMGRYYRNDVVKYNNFFEDNILPIFEKWFMKLFLSIDVLLAFIFFIESNG